MIWLAKKIAFRAINTKYYLSTHKTNRNYFTNPITTIAGKTMSDQQINNVMRKVEKFSGKHAGKNRNNLYSVYSLEKEMIPQKLLDSKSMIVFEGREYPTVADPHAYLTHLYGDYMTPPPENERNVKKHSGQFL